MADTYFVKVTEQAQEQLRSIADYIALDCQAPDAALRLLELLENKITALAQFPHRIALTEEEPWHSYGVHKMPVKNFLIYFWIDEDACKVQVIAVVYNKRDQIDQLSKAVKSTKNNL